MAVYRDENGELHEGSAGCPHLSTEKSWDCPCHGSRFDTQGLVLNGPAVQGLALVEEPVKA